MSSEDRTYIGIDYGRKRVGVAKSDPTGLIASPLATLVVKSDNDAVAQVVKLLEEWKPRSVVVGYPLLKSGDPSDTCKRIDRFVAKLKEVYPVDVHLEDEIYSSQEAEEIIHAHGKRIGVDKKRVDRLAAVIILERFLEDQAEESK